MIAEVFLDFDFDGHNASGKRSSAESSGGREGERASRGSNGGSGLDVSELSKFLGGNGTERVR